MNTVEIRPAAVAGMFYPDDAATLTRDIQFYLDHAESPVSLPQAPKALIVPHAGYIYSGPIAASAYALLKPWRDVIRRVVLLGPVHRVPVRGLALPGCQGFATPLGAVPIDQIAVERLHALRQVTTSVAAHALEHSLEVQLPFLQKVLGDFSLVPLAVGDATPAAVAEVLETLWGGPETLIVISSDLSHFHRYEQARHIDAETCDTIRQLRANIDHNQACGGTPVNGLMEVARRHHLIPHLLDLRNSGDTAGDRRRVVGYAAFAFTEPTAHGH
jgi:AmmeMemoRadiSam system protein B